MDVVREIGRGRPLAPAEHAFAGQEVVKPNSRSVADPGAAFANLPMRLSFTANTESLSRYLVSASKIWLINGWQPSLEIMKWMWPGRHGWWPI